VGPENCLSAKDMIKAIAIMILAKRKGMINLKHPPSAIIKTRCFATNECCCRILIMKKVKWGWDIRISVNNNPELLDDILINILSLIVRVFSCFQ